MAAVMYDDVPSLHDVFPSIANDQVLSQALYTAIDYKRYDSLKYLLEYASIPRILGEELLLHACDIAERRSVEVILEKTRVDPGIQENACLIGSIQRKDIDMVRLLMQDTRVDPTKPDNLGLRLAIETQNMTLITPLLEHPLISLDFSKNFPLRYAAEYGVGPLLDYLFEKRDVWDVNVLSDAYSLAHSHGHLNIAVKIGLQKIKSSQIAWREGR